MDLKTEKEIYRFCQYLNTDKDDSGTTLFVSHLYQSGQLKHLFYLFNGPLTISVNNDLAYLIASEKLLEKFASRFDSLLRSFEENQKKEIYPDVVVNVRSLITSLESFKKDILILDSSFSAEKLYLCIARFVKTASSKIKEIINQNCNVSTNINNFIGLLKNIRRLEFKLTLGSYFYYRGK